MSRIPLITGPVHPTAQAELDRQLEAHGRVTHMKRTLAHSPAAITALMTWYPLRDEVAVFLGDRATTLFAHAVSTETGCLICSTFFRRILIDAGENPDALTLDQRESVIVDFGLALARNHSRVPEGVYARVVALLQPAQIVALTAFGAMMLATNVFNNALDIDLDDYLAGYRRPGSVT